jgi:predicted PhzF superfamily epimerase YddE/YHI9
VGSEAVQVVRPEAALAMPVRVVKARVAAVLRWAPVETEARQTAEPGELAEALALAARAVQVQHPVAVVEAADTTVVAAAEPTLMVVAPMAVVAVVDHHGTTQR